MRSVQACTAKNSMASIYGAPVDGYNLDLSCSMSTPVFSVSITSVVTP